MLKVKILVLKFIFSLTFFIALLLSITAANLNTLYTSQKFTNSINNKINLRLKSSSTSSINSNSNILGVSTTSDALSKYSAWIPHYDFQNGLKSAESYRDKINEIHYAGATIDVNGNISKVANFNNHINSLNSKGFQIGINIFSESPDNIYKFISSNNLQTFTETLKNYSNIKTINLNFEKLNSKDSQLLINFLGTNKALLNLKNIKLYLTIYPKSTNSNFTLNSFTDISTLTNVTNKLVLMFYDYKQINPSIRFGNSSVNWLNDELRKIPEEVRISKISIALPLYAYEFNSNGGIIKSYTFSQLNLNQKTILIDENTSEKYFINGSNRVYLQDKETLLKLRNTSTSVGVNDIFYWRLGGDNGIGF